jgi:Terminase large subunit, T4likevirus-type, N-terminal
MTALPTPSGAYGPCEPTYLTPPSDLPTMGPQVRAVMDELGTPALPWEVEVLDILYEYEPTSTGPAFRFHEGIATTPRQCGKSSLALAILMHRVIVLTDRPQLAVYSAQTGHDARRKFMDDFLPLMQASAMGRFVTRIRRASGHEAVFFGPSRVEAISSNETAGHGRVIDLAVVDEAFADEDDRREQALLPAMLTRSARTGGSPMLFIASTAGTDMSIYLKRKVDAGRESVHTGVDGGTFFCEYGMPENCDLDDEGLWWRHHPGLAGGLISIEAIRHLRHTMTESEFLRAVANQWVRTEDLLIPFDLWRAAQDVVAAPGQPHFSVDLNPERTHTSICAADKDGAVELIEHRAGTVWVVERCKHLLATHRSSRLVVDGHGPAGTLLPDLERACGARRLKVVNSHELAQASATFYDGVTEGWMRVRPNLDLDMAVAGAKKRMRSDAFTWARAQATVDLSPLVSASLAIWFARTFNPPRPRIA